LGYDLRQHFSKGLDALPPVEFDVVVGMGCGDACPQVRARQREEWDIPDPKCLPSDQFRLVRDQIRDRVARLLDRLRGANAI
ncbi:MAG: arsenate reductase ArsC, partial [Gemmataceae bacterium]|nr:arsenate reductase ArsC [Gemmataceae bacterium]